MAIARALVRPPSRRSSADREAIVRNAALAGLRVELPPEPEDPGVEVWPDHVDTMEVAQAMMSQMNVGMAGPIGWRYESLPVVCRLLGVPLARQREIFPDLRLVESVMLDAMSEGKR